MLCSSIYSNALEELSVRADIALSQKKVIHDISTEGQEDEEFENEYLALSAQVVRGTMNVLSIIVNHCLTKLPSAGQGDT